MSFKNTGAEKRLSVGISKNPWICPACRSTVSTRSAPAAVIMLATSLAEIGVGPGGLCCRPGRVVIGERRVVGGGGGGVRAAHGGARRSRVVFLGGGGVLDRDRH